MSDIITVGLDLAKNEFQAHAADDFSRAVLQKKLRRDQVLGFSDGYCTAWLRWKQVLGILFRFAIEARECAAGGTSEAALSAATRTTDLQTYLSRNLSAHLDYGRQRRQVKAVLTSRIEGLVNEIANVRMGKKPRMWWSSRCSQRVATVRAAVLDESLLTRSPNAA